MEYFAKWRFFDEETGYINDEGWVQFSEDELASFRKFIEQERSAYIGANPNHKDDKTLWDLWMKDAWQESGIKAECPNVLGYYEEAYIDFIDLDNPK